MLTQKLERKPEHRVSRRRSFRPCDAGSRYLLTFPPLRLKSQSFRLSMPEKAGTAMEAARAAVKES